LALVQRLAALELRGGVFELRLGHVEARLRLGQVVLRNPRVDLREELPLLHLVPRLHRHGDDLPRRFRFHAKGQNRLDHAGGGHLAARRGRIGGAGPGPPRAATSVPPPPPWRGCRPAAPPPPPPGRCARPNTWASSARSAGVGSAPLRIRANAACTCSAVTPGGSAIVRPFGVVNVAPAFVLSAGWGLLRRAAVALSPPGRDAPSGSWS